MSKYTKDERRAMVRIRDLANAVRKHQAGKLSRGKLPDLEYKAEKGAIISLLVAQMNEKYISPKLRF